MGGSDLFFGGEDLTVYFFGSEKSARIFLCIFLGLKCPVLYFFGCHYKVHVFFWVQNIRLRRTPTVTFIPK